MKKLLISIAIFSFPFFLYADNLSYEEIDQLNAKPIKHTSKGKYRTYVNYFFYFTPYNTILPNDPRSPVKDLTDSYRDDILDENADNFSYGQFAVFIPSNYTPLSTECDFLDISMPGTLDRKNKTEVELSKFIEEKQNLYFEIKNMVESGHGHVKAVVEEFSYGYRPCRLYFRDAYGRHIKYIGQYKGEAAGWLYKGQVLPPNTFKKEWMSSDNFEAFQDHFDLKDMHVLRRAPGYFFGKAISHLDPIMASWGEPVSLAVAIDDVDFGQPYHLEETDHGIEIVHLTDGIGTVNGEERYRIMNDISLEDCNLMAPYINGSCKEAYKVHVSTWNGGSMGHHSKNGIYGLFEMDDGKEYIVPLYYMDNDTNLYIAEAKYILLNNLSKLTSLSKECVYLKEDGTTESYIGLNLREIHNDECGGDPNTDVSIGYYRVDQDRELWMMDYLDGSYKRIRE